MSACLCLGDDCVISTYLIRESFGLSLFIVVLVCMSSGLLILNLALITDIAVRMFWEVIDVVKGMW